MAKDEARGRCTNETWLQIVLHERETQLVDRKLTAVYPECARLLNNEMNISRKTVGEKD